MKKKPTTQSVEYRSRKKIKNLIRQRILPSVTKDISIGRRYTNLAEKVHGGNVLVVGVGDKKDYYCKTFSKSLVITSDVHCQFGADIVFDTHRIPFSSNFFTLVLAAQVLEHTCRPWITASEMQRVTKPGGYIQVEVPFIFPFHGIPFDFYRFTPSSLSFLFPQCKIIDFEIPEGNWSGAAVALENALINSFKNRYFRIIALFFGRLLFWWLKYLDRLFQKCSYAIPKGYSVTYLKDGKNRSDRQLIEETMIYQ